jgi:hypothetical protein
LSWTLDQRRSIHNKSRPPQQEANGMENDIQQKIVRYEKFVNESLRKDLKDTLDARDTVYEQISE